MATPLRIRSRLKSLLGLGGTPKAERPAPQRVDLVVVGPGDREQRAQTMLGQTVLLSAGNLASPIASGCSDSSCSTCRVEVLEGADMLTPRSEVEVQTLKANGREADLRLACIATIDKVGSGTLRVRAFEFLE